MPQNLVNLTCPNVALKFSPLVAIEPRRRRFHNPVQVALPLSAVSKSKCKDPKSRVRLLCSLAASSTPKALFEDVTEMTHFTISKGKLTAFRILSQHLAIKGCVRTKTNVALYQ